MVLFLACCVFRQYSIKYQLPQVICTPEGLKGIKHSVASCVSNRDRHCPPEQNKSSPVLSRCSQYVGGRIHFSCFAINHLFQQHTTRTRSTRQVVFSEGCFLFEEDV